MTTNVTLEPATEAPHRQKNKIDLVLYLIILLVGSFAIYLWVTGARQDPIETGEPHMKAIVHTDYGSPDVLALKDIKKPAPNDNQVLLKVRAAAANPLDWHMIRGMPYIMRLMGVGLRKPTSARRGADVAGQVEAVGKSVTQFKPGDEVFGTGGGTFAEYARARETKLVLKPANITFEQAAGVPVAALTALQGLRDNGKIRAGQKVLINGASGGVGTFAVQIAKSFGAEVTGICSTRNVDLVRSLGADHVIDYTKEDFTRGAEHYDLILDNVGNQPLSGFRRALTPKGICVMVGGGGPNDGEWIGAIWRPVKAFLYSPFVSQTFTFFVADIRQDDLTFIRDLMQAGKVSTVIDRTYPLTQVAEAIRYVEEGHARGKVIITVPDTNVTLPVSARPGSSAGTTPGPNVIAGTLIGIPVGVLIVPIIIVIALNSRFQRRNPGKRSYRWGYYFSTLSFIAGLALGVMFGGRLTAVIVCAAIYGLLAWFFAQRHHWAWITLTILSFNPLAWIINFFYLRKRWAESR